ncbi:GAF domain-containing protein [Streptococcus pneumoniae]|nr:GAF domain-containing protein [Streptococcus pneumoniae]
MFTKESYAGSRVQQYEIVIKQLDALLTGESNVVANLSNASALLNQFLDRVNWVGFYVTEGNQLVLGPFQGMPACVRIPFGRGVCGVLNNDIAASITFCFVCFMRSLPLTEQL